MNGLLGLLISLIILLLVLAVVYWIARQITTHLGTPPVVMVVVEVLLALVALVWLLNVLVGFPSRFPMR